MKSRTSVRKAASSGLARKSTGRLRGNAWGRRLPFWLERVSALSPLDLQTSPQRRRHLVPEAEGLEPAADPGEDAAVVLVSDARAHRVLVGKAPAHMHLAAVAGPGHAVIEEVRAEKADEHLLRQEI